MAAGALAEWADASSVAIGLFLVAIGLSSPMPVRGAFRALKRRVLDINVLMVIAVLGAALLDEWFEAAAVVWLFGVAQWLEARSLDRARRAIRRLMTLAPDSALVRRGEQELDVPVAEVVPGDILIIRPGGRVPVDGVVVRGTSALDQSPVTGESWPVEKAAGDLVFAATINGAGAIEVRATHRATDSTLARIIHLVEKAEGQRAPAQRWVDRFATRYTPTVVALAVLVAVVPPLLGGWGVDASTWFYRSLALLVVACPCALVISTPVSIVSALTSAARAGVLIKGGVHLERLGTVKCVAFDKTGTLTAGKITVAEVQPVDGASAAGVLSIAASLEVRSEHPIGRAIVSRARAEQLEVVAGDGFRALPGLGAEAAVGSSPAVVGSHRLFEERQLCTPALHAQVEAVESRGRTAVLVGYRGTALGVLGLVDDVRENGRRAVVRLREVGISRVVLLTGDRRASADTARDGAGLDEAHADLMPGDKVNHVVRLRGTYGPVAMVGDGINDAPALAAADVGIAMGVAGTDVAIETADVALLTDDLEKLPYAMRLGRATLSTIRTNVGIALGLKLAFVVLAVTGGATLWMAVLADTGASLLVTANSLRLLRVR
jgi:Cd2+/Zn2+-exporting ATPase